MAGPAQSGAPARQSPFQPTQRSERGLAIPVDVAIDHAHHHHHHGHPAVSQDGRRLFVGGHSGSFYCLDVFTGQIVWRSLVKGPFDGTPTVYDDFVFAGSGGGRDTPLQVRTDTSCGNTRWTRHRRQTPGARRPTVVHHGQEHHDRPGRTNGQVAGISRREVPSARFQIKGVSNPLVTEDCRFRRLLRRHPGQDKFRRRQPAGDQEAVRRKRTLHRRGHRIHCWWTESCWWRPLAVASRH